MSIFDFLQKPKQQEPAPIPKVKIVVADDELYLRDFYKELLEGEGFDVITATNGQETLDAVRKYMPALVLLDIMMPVIDGNEVLKILSENEATKKIPVIMLTNAGSIENMEHAKLHSAYKFFIKSNVEPEEIIKTVHEALLNPHNNSI